MGEPGTTSELHTLFQEKARITTPEGDVDTSELRQTLLTRFQETVGTPDSPIEAAAEEAIHFINTRIAHWKSRLSSDELADKTRDLLDSFPETLFFMPAAVQALYAPEPSANHAWVAQGIHFHCEFIKKASAQVCRRYQESIRHLPIDSQSIEDELYSCTLEEIVKSLSDSQARVWHREKGTYIEIPPTRKRGWKSIVIARVALNADGSRLLTLRSDAHLGLWSLPDGELLQTWNLSSPGQSINLAWNAPRFSLDGRHIAWQLDDARIALLTAGNESVSVFDSSGQKEFKNRFGELLPIRPDNKPEISITDRWNRTMPLSRYQQDVLHWSATPDGLWIATGSETTRGMPQWMQDIGFQNAVYHILKRRLVDTIRKQTHTSPVQTQTEEDSSGESHPVSLGAFQIDTPVEDLVGSDLAHVANEPDSHWSDEHDFERILAVLAEVTITYKDRILTCDKLVRWKAEGLTNADIGDQLGIPRGTVDYLWNQCKQQIQLIFGDTLL